MTEPLKTKSKMTYILPLLVVCVVAAGVYVMNGNDANETSSTGDISAVKIKADKIEDAAQGDVAAMVALDQPLLMPEHQFVGSDGTSMSLNDFGGKMLLVNLWATWCAPCREEMPALSELQSAKAGDDFSVVTINIDRGDRAKPEGFLKDVGIDNLALYQDASMGIFNALKKEGIAFGLPVTMLMDENGYIIASMNGPAHWSGADALAYIDAAIAEKGK